MDDDTHVRIQVLAAKEEAGPGPRALAVARECRRDLAAIGRELGAEALLICPAPEAFKPAKSP